jgi:hypothetical protein
MTNPTQHPPAEILATFLDGTLEAATRSTVEHHVATCAPCRDEVKHARRAKEALGKLPSVSAPPDLASKISTEVGDGIRRGRRHRGEHRASGSRKLPALLAAAAVIVALVVAIPVLREGTGDRRDALVSAGSSEELRLRIDPTQDFDDEAIRQEALRVSASVRGDAATSVEPPPETSTNPGESQPDEGTVGRFAGPGRTRLALRCLNRAFEGFPGTPVELTRASYEGTPAYIAAVSEPGGIVSIWVAAVDGCRILALSSAAG